MVVELLQVGLYIEYMQVEVEAVRIIDLVLVLVVLVVVEVVDKAVVDIQDHQIPVEVEVGLV
jgi:hypothetical protein